MICARAAIVAVVTDEASHDLPAYRPEEPAFEVWRRRIQEYFAERSMS
jgi:hypothetical protein